MSMWGLGDESLLPWVGVGLCQHLYSWVGQSYIQHALPKLCLGVQVRSSTVHALGISQGGTDVYMFSAPRSSLPIIHRHMRENSE